MLPFISPSAPKIFLGSFDQVSNVAGGTYELINFSTLKIPRDVYSAFLIEGRVNIPSATFTSSLGTGNGTGSTNIASNILAASGGNNLLFKMFLRGFYRSVNTDLFYNWVIGSSASGAGILASHASANNCIGLNSTGSVHQMSWNLMGIK